MVFNTTFNNISVISGWSVLLVEETRVPTDLPQQLGPQRKSLNNFFAKIPDLVK
jgi:hypothetical protein